MSEQPPPRVRVTGPSRRPTRRTARPRRSQIDEETRLGEIYLRSLLREQLRLAGLALLLLAVGLGGLPLLFWLVPDLAAQRVAGPDQNEKVRRKFPCRDRQRMGEVIGFGHLMAQRVIPHRVGVAGPWPPDLTPPVD